MGRTHHFPWIDEPVAAQRARQLGGPPKDILSKTAVVDARRIDSLVRFAVNEKVRITDEQHGATARGSTDTLYDSDGGVSLAELARADFKKNLKYTARWR